MQVRELEDLMANQAAWETLSKREQQEKETVLRQESESPCTSFLHDTDTTIAGMRRGDPACGVSLQGWVSKGFWAACRPWGEVD